ncbi:hypothetical protein Q4E93_00125 [Flavitalea sp. BT771]|uniref:hypothetical protein n=1 Tax=Flavitalea sp. BT771 TaxID=3063329 RepID=UPI0026E1CE1B|nr:hypothetical protein [Flavitalea sp. BT771]MDO6428970.1 hypothetical protein [Flavitalea sp. BT771]MDV6218902.1 hypothetical protein [Flavitalea sp. BT771]
MSVNLPRTYRVILVIAIVGVAFSTLAWSGDNSHTSTPRPALDTIPARHPKQDKKAAKPARKAEEGRVARELDLRIDAEEPDEWMAGAEVLDDMDVRFNLDDLKGLNARIEADVLKNVDAWKSLEFLKEPDALEELNSVEIDENALQELKDMNIDEDIWNELRELKSEMDYLRDEINEDVSGKIEDYRIREEVRRVVEAVQSEIPRVRREVEKAMEACRDGGKQWQ